MCSEWLVYILMTLVTRVLHKKELSALILGTI